MEFEGKRRRRIRGKGKVRRSRRDKRRTRGKFEVSEAVGGRKEE